MAGREMAEYGPHRNDGPVRAIAQIAGNVQGVGFRPYLYQLATQHGLRGNVANSAHGVDLEVEGPRPDVEAFLADIPQHLPPLADIIEITHRFAEPVGHPAFVIAASRTDGHQTALIAPDVSICDDCLREMFDPTDRRYRYPFINCTNCGPRFTIIAGIPYDRPATTMACFSMCAACREEYEDPANRRFHAQPNACPKCGPKVWFVTTDQADPDGPTPWPAAPETDPAGDPIDRAAALLASGAMIAVKGLGGFHLACDATNSTAVAALRQRKSREEKPLALMVPDLATARRLCQVDAAGQALLLAKERPITLLPRRTDAPVADGVAPGNPHLGLMLPYTPLHYRLLFEDASRPRFDALVMTSGNRKDEPIAIGNREAIRRLRPLADAFLLHNRDILIRADDSVVRPDSTGIVFLRRSRGYVPGPIFLNQSAGAVGTTVSPPFRNVAGTDVCQRGDVDPTALWGADGEGAEPRDAARRRDGSSRAKNLDNTPASRPAAPDKPGRTATLGTKRAVLQHGVGQVLAVGGHLKNTIAVAQDNTVFLSQHIGDLDNLEAAEFLDQAVDHLRCVLRIEPRIIAHDLHPDYLSTRLAERLFKTWQGTRLVAVQHHHAHVVSCMAEHALDGPVIGVALDGTGLGTDGTVWGGEILVADDARFRRAAHLRPVPLPGGERAIREPWRMALSYLDAAYGDDLWQRAVPWLRHVDRPAAEIVLRAARRGLNSPPTTGCGRLFDAVAALAGIRQQTTYEGQAAMELEMTLETTTARMTDASYPFPVVDPPAAGQPLVLDPVRLIRAVMEDVHHGVPAGLISLRFHAALVQALAEAVGRIVDRTGLRRVVLSGGCFLNRFLTHRLLAALTDRGLAVFTHRRVPPGDGGLALGQVVVAARRAGA